MTQLVFHVGDPKTGTSSIQSALWHKLCQPTDQTIRPWTNVNAVRMGKNLSKQDTEACAENFAAINQWVNGATEDFSVISGESFARAKPAFIKRLVQNHLPEHAEKFRVIAYARPHASRLLSGFQQRTKMGINDIDLPTFRDRITRNNSEFHYAPRFSRWEDAIGDRFELHPFVRSELKNGDAVNDFFFHLLGNDQFEIKSHKVENVSLRIRGLSSLRLFRQVLKNQGIAPDPRNSFGFTLANHHINSKTQAGPKPYIDKTSAEIMIDVFLKDAQAIDNRYFGKPILETELLKAADTEHVEPFSLAAEAHFSDKEIKDMSGHAREFAKNCGGMAILWAVHTKANRGLNTPNEIQAAKLKKNRARLRQLDKLAEEFSVVAQG
jgi:hypothetical protein